MKQVNDEKDNLDCKDDSCQGIESCDCQGICTCEPEINFEDAPDDCEGCCCGDDEDCDGDDEDDDQV